MLGRSRKKSYQDKAMDTVGNLRDQAGAMAHSIAGQTAVRAASGAQHVKDAGTQLAGQSFRSVGAASHRVGDDLVPTVREVAAQAAAAAVDLWQMARERAEDVLDSAHQEIADPAAHLLGSAQAKARDTSSAVAQRADVAGEQAREMTRRAADATVHAGKDTGATVFWAGAATGIVFYALLSKERREQVLQVVDSIVGQTKEIIRDFQGYDEKFQ